MYSGAFQRGAFMGATFRCRIDKTLLNQSLKYSDRVPPFPPFTSNRSIVCGFMCLPTGK